MRTVVTTEILLVIGLLGFVVAAYAVERSFSLGAAVRLSPLSALFVAAVPAMLWLVYFYLQDRLEPEPKHYVLGVYLLGALVAAPLSEFIGAQVAPPAPFAAQSLESFGMDRLVRVFLVIGVAQELCKYLVVRYTVYLSPEFDEPLDGIIYMTAAGIGFATWENYHYFQGLDGNVFLTIGAAHAVKSTLAHACFAGVLGYFLGRAKFSASPPMVRSATLFLGLLIATLLNGQFSLIQDVVTSDGIDVEPWRGVAYAGGFAALVFFATSILMRRLLAISPFRDGGGKEP